MSSQNCIDIFSQNWPNLFIKVIRHHGIDIKRTKVVESVDDLWFKQYKGRQNELIFAQISPSLNKWVHRWTNEFSVDQLSSSLNKWAHRWTNELIVEQMISSLNKWVPFLTIEQRRQYAKALNFNTCFDQGLEYMSKINHLFLFSSFISIRWLVWM